MAKTYSDTMKSQIVNNDDLSSLQLSGKKMEIIEFVAATDKEFTELHLANIFQNILGLMEDSFLTRLEFKEFIINNTSSFIKSNL